MFDLVNDFTLRTITTSDLTREQALGAESRLPDGVAPARGGRPGFRCGGCVHGGFGDVAAAVAMPPDRKDKPPDPPDEGAALLMPARWDRCAKHRVLCVVDLDP